MINMLIQVVQMIYTVINGVYIYLLIRKETKSLNC